MARAKISTQTRMSVFNRAGGICYLCGEPIDKNLPPSADGAFQVEHIIPVAAGGRNDLSNYAAAHKRCNAIKRDLPLDAAMDKVRVTLGRSREW